MRRPHETTSQFRVSDYYMNYYKQAECGTDPLMGRWRRGAGPLPLGRANHSSTDDSPNDPEPAIAGSSAGA